MLKLPWHPSTLYFICRLQYSVNGVFSITSPGSPLNVKIIIVHVIILHPTDQVKKGAVVLDTFWTSLGCFAMRLQQAKCQDKDLTLSPPNESIILFIQRPLIGWHGRRADQALAPDTPPVPSAAAIMAARMRGTLMAALKRASTRARPAAPIRWRSRASLSRESIAPASALPSST